MRCQAVDEVMTGPVVAAAVIVVIVKCTCGRLILPLGASRARGWNQRWCE